MDLPKITVVTPSYNQGRFLDDTIVSVLGQDYPNLEYFVLDGGSTDGSVDIIKRHQGRIAYWVSERDGGQSVAINRGFARATGDILVWLNSDDTFLPGTLRYVASTLRTELPELLCGNCFHFVDGGSGAWGSSVPENHRTRNLRLCDYIIQPASFWTRRAWTLTGALDEGLTFGFDWDWYIRAQAAGVTLRATERYLAAYRVHAEHKTGTGGDARLRELASLYTRHAGRRYEDLFWACCRARARIGAVRGIAGRLGAKRLAPAFLRLTYPEFRAFDWREIEDVLSMI